MKRTANINCYLKSLKKKNTQAYLTNSLQVADVLEWILEQVGVADVWQTTFSVSEEYLRRLYFLRKKSGKINSITVLLDRKATNKTINLWQFLKEVVQDVYLADNHSKILLVKSLTGQKVSVITSQNLTRGNRSESAVVSTDEHVFDTLMSQLKELINYHSVPIYELFRKATGGYQEDGIGLYDDYRDGIDHEFEQGGAEE